MESSLPSPTSPHSIDKNLTLLPRIKLNLKIDPTNPNSSFPKPIDEWQLKRSLIEFFKSQFSTPITIPEHDILLTRHKDLKKRKRDDPIATGTLCIRDVSFISDTAKKYINLAEDENNGVLERRYLEWRRVIVEKTNGIELNLVGVKLTLSVSVSKSDDFERMRKEWEEFYAFRDQGMSRGGGRQQPDTVVLRGVPSRWFAETRVSSKPSMLVTHTIFSSFGKIRNLNVAEDNDLGEGSDDNSEQIVPGLNCKIVVQFEKYKDFYNALKVLSGCSLEKQGSRMRVDYEVNWSKEGFFQNTRNDSKQQISRRPTEETKKYRSEAPRRQSYNSRYSPDYVHRKRLKLNNRSTIILIQLDTKSTPFLIR